MNIKEDLLKKLSGLKLDEFLSPREQKIISMRFGIPVGEFLSQETHTLEEIGCEYGVTRERVRQIESKVLQKIIKHK